MNFYSTCKWVLSGMLIGVANIIPGVSGSTMAVLTNQYSSIITQIEIMVSLKLRQINYMYLFVIMLSAAVGVVLFSYPLHYFFVHFESYTLIAIVALIVGSLEAVQISTEQRSLLKKIMSPFCVSGVMLLVGLMLVDAQFEGAMMESNAVMLFLSGVVAMVAMLIPGISGSMVLVMLGTYDLILLSIKTLAIGPLLPFGFGVAAGGVSCIKLIQWLIKRHAVAFESFVMGLLLGSIIYMMNLVDFSSIHPVMGIILSVVGILVSMGFVAYGNR